MITKHKKKKKTWFNMPRWVVACGIAAFLSLAGAVGVVLAKDAYVQPPPVRPAPPVRTLAPKVSFQPGDPDPSPDPEDEIKVPPGNWNEIGRKESVFTVLIVGADDTSNTDTIMVAALDAKNNKIDVMSIPRDTQVNVRRPVKKINAAWAHGGKGEKGMDQLRAEIKTLIGFVPDAYVLVELKGFVRLVDAIDGVWFDVPRNMNYRDPDQRLYINLQKGYQLLDGEKAVQLVRWRQDNRGGGYRMGDTDRVAMQHEFLKAVAKQTLTLGNLFKIGEFIDIANDNLETDLDLGSMLWFGQEILKVSDEDVHFHMLPVDIGAKYYNGDYALVRRDEALELINQTVNHYLLDRTADDLDISRLVDYWG